MTGPNTPDKPNKGYLDADKVAPKAVADGRDKRVDASVDSAKVVAAPGPEDREGVSTSVAESVTLTAVGKLIEVEDKTDALAGVEIDETRFGGLLKEIKKINGSGSKAKITLSVEDGKTLLIQGKEKELKLPVDTENFSEALFKALQEVLSEFKNATAEGNEYAKMAEDLGETRNPALKFLQVLLMWAAEHPGIADSLFYKGGFIDKVRNGSYKSAAFEDEEMNFIVAEYKEKTEDERKQIATDIPANYDGVRASIHYMQKVLWPNGEFDYEGPAALANELYNSTKMEGNEVHSLYEVQEDHKEFKQNPKEGSIVFFKYGDGAGNAMMEGFEQIVALGSFVTQDESAKDKKPNLLVGHVRKGRVEFYLDGNVQTMAMNDPKFGLMLAFSPSKYLEQKRNPALKEREDLRLQLKTNLDNAKSAMDQKAAEIKALEMEITDIEKMEALSTSITEMEAGKSADEISQLSGLEAETLRLAKAELKALVDKRGDYIAVLETERPQYLSEKRHSLGEEKKLLEPLKKAYAEAKTAYEKIA